MVVSHQNKNWTRQRPPDHAGIGRQGGACRRGARGVETQAPGRDYAFKEIAQIAGVDPALIRYYFGQLSDLFAEAATEITRELRGRLAALIAQKGSARESLQRRISSISTYFVRYPNYHRLIIELASFG